MKNNIVFCKNKSEACRVLAGLAPNQQEMVTRVQQSSAPVIIVIVNEKSGEMEVRKTMLLREAARFCLHNLEMDTDAARVYVCGKELVLTALEYRIMHMLLSAPGKVFSRKEIFEKCWDDSYMEDDGTVNVHMSHIRQKIKKLDGTRNYIRTVRGIGFAME